MRLIHALAVVALVGAAQAAAQAPAAKPPKVRKEKPDSGPATPAPLKRLFTATAPLEMTVTTDLKAFVKTHERSAALRPATLTFGDSSGPVTLPIQLGVRGNFRLMSRNCSFPPTRIVLDSTVRKTVFAGQKRLKLVTRCQKSDEYDQYILQEYNLYRIYNLLTPYSLHARLARVTFADQQKKEDPITMWAFLLEDDSDMAKRNAATLFDQKGALWDDLEPRTLRLMSLFEFLIGNTDWSVAGLHNVKLVRDPSMEVRTVAYDFDWSGVISTRYARPDPRLPIRAVRERLFRGPCLTEAELASASATFIEKKDAIYALYRDLPQLAQDNVKNTLAYFDDFYRILADRRRAKREILETCQPRGN